MNGNAGREPEPGSHRPGCTEREAALLRALTRALRKLGKAGDPDAANRIAARAWSEIRQSDPDAAERLNGTMHYLARLPDPVDAPRSHDPLIRRRKEPDHG